MRSTCWTGIERTCAHGASLPCGGARELSPPSRCRSCVHCSGAERKAQKAAGSGEQVRDGALWAGEQARFLEIAEKVCSVCGRRTSRACVAICRSGVMQMRPNCIPGHAANAQRRLQMCRKRRARFLVLPTLLSVSVACECVKEWAQQEAVACGARRWPRLRDLCCGCGPLAGACLTHTYLAGEIP